MFDQAQAPPAYVGGIRRSDAVRIEAVPFVKNGDVAQVTFLRHLYPNPAAAIALVAVRDRINHRLFETQSRKKLVAGFDPVAGG